MEKLIGLNEFVKRQVKNSRFSYYDGSFEELRQLCIKEFINLDKSEINSPTEGIILLKVNPDKFFSGLTNVTEETILKASFIKRQEKEAPFVNVVAKNQVFVPAAKVEIVLYSYDRLRLKNEHDTECDWEIVSINVYPDKVSSPMNPLTMARNYLNLEGGTKTEYTAKEFADSILYWSTHVMIDNTFS